MSTRSHGAGDEHELAASRAWRDEAIRLSREHDRRYHAGEHCLDHAAGLVAFAAHALGLRSTDAARLAAVARVLAEYEEHHAG